MDEALVEHAEHDVDRHRRGQNQPWLAGKRAAELGGVARIAAHDGRRYADVALRIADRRDRAAERSPGRQIEADGDRRELRLMADGERRDGALHASEGADRNLRAV